MPPGRLFGISTERRFLVAPVKSTAARTTPPISA
jgi:hypothetical protein